MSDFPFLKNKSLGQHFLIDPFVVDELVETAMLKEGENVLEIGPGEGVVTAEILARKVNLKAVELDERLIAPLTVAFKANKFEVIHGNILDIKFADFFQRPFKIISSLPYQITSPFIRKIVYEGIESRNINSVSLVIQDEVAKKITDHKGKTCFLSNFLKLWGNVEYIQRVEDIAFDPIPKIHSAIVYFTPHQVDYKIEPRVWEGFLHKAYSNPRKMLNKVFTIEHLNSANIPPSKRAEDLSFEDLMSLFHKN